MNPAEAFTDKVWEDAEINQGVRQLPAMIAKQTHAVIEAEAQLKETKHLIHVAEAAVKVRYIGVKKSAGELNAIAFNETHELHKQLLNEEKQLEISRAYLQYYRDMFDSCRKAANLKIEELRRLEGTYSKRQPDN